MDPLTYKVKIDGDTSNLKKALEMVGGQLNKLEDQIVIKLDYDGNYKNFNKTLQRVYKQAPEVGIRFQYDLNQEALKKAKKDLQNMEVYSSYSNSEEKLKKVYNEAVKIANIKPDGTRDWNDSKLRNYRIELIKLTDAMEEADLDRFEKALNETVEGNSKQFTAMASVLRLIKGFKDDVNFDVPTTQDASRQRKLIQEIEDNIQAMESQFGELGKREIVLKINTDQFDSEIQRVKKEIESLEDKTISVKPIIDQSGGTLANIQESLKTIDDKSIALKLNTSSFTTSLNRIKDSLSAVENKDVVIKLTTNSFTTSLNRIKSELAELDTKNVVLKLTTNGFTSSLNRIKTELSTIEDKSVTVRLITNSFTTSLNRVKKELENIEESNVKLQFDKANLSNEFGKRLGELDNNQINLRINESYFKTQIDKIKNLIRSLSEDKIQLNIDATKFQDDILNAIIEAGDVLQTNTPELASLYNQGASIFGSGNKRTVKKSYRQITRAEFLSTLAARRYDAYGNRNRREEYALIDSSTGRVYGLTESANDSRVTPNEKLDLYDAALRSGIKFDTDFHSHPQKHATFSFFPEVREDGAIKMGGDIAAFLQKYNRFGTKKFLIHSDTEYMQLDLSKIDKGSIGYIYQDLVDADIIIKELARQAFDGTSYFSDVYSEFINNFKDALPDDKKAHLKPFFDNALQLAGIIDDFDSLQAAMKGIKNTLKQSPDFDDLEPLLKKAKEDTDYGKANARLNNFYQLLSQRALGIIFNNPDYLNSYEDALTYGALPSRFAFTNEPDLSDFLKKRLERAYGVLGDRLSAVYNDRHLYARDSNEYTYIPSFLSDEGVSVKTGEEELKAKEKLAEESSKSAEATQKETEAIKENERALQQQEQTLKEVANAEETVAESKQQSTKQYENQVKQIDNIVDRLNHEKAQGKYTSQFYGDIEKANSLLAEAKSLDFTNQADVDRLDEIISKIREIDRYSSKDKSNRVGNNVSIANLLKSAQSDFAKYSGMDASHKDQYTAFIDNLKARVEDFSDTSVEDVKRIAEEYARLKGDLIETGNDVPGMFSTIQERLRGINAQFIAQYFSIQDWIRYGRQALEIVKEVDSALTELRKVSDASDSRLAQSLKYSSDVAKELGTNIKDVINITADWSRLGYSIDDSEVLAKATALFTNVGDNMTSDESSSYLVSTLKGFQITADDVMKVVDKYNNVANNFAIDTKGIGEALKRSAASFNAAHTDLDKSIALITTTNAVLQNPESVGTLYKTLSARIRGAKTELQDLGEETDIYVESTSKLRDMVKGMTGFDIMESDGKTYKDIYDILLGIGEQWDKLSDIDQASLAEALAGKRMANGLFAVLQNPDELKRVYETSLDSTNSALREQENYAKSIEYNIGVLKANAQALAIDFVNTDFIINTTKGLSGIVGGLDLVIEKTNALIPILTAIIAMAIRSNGGIKTIVKSISDINKLKAAASTGSVTAKDMANAANGYENLIGMAKTFAVTAGISAAVALVYDFATASEKAREQLATLTEEANRQRSQLNGYADQVAKEKAILEDNIASYDAQCKARENLFEIQSKLREAYGDEIADIDIMTVSVDGLAEAFNNLTKAEWEEKKAKFNQGGGVADKVYNELTGQSRLDRVLNEYSNYSVLDSASLGMSNPDLLNKYGLALTNDGMRISGNVEDILAFYKELINSGEVAEYSINNVKKAISELEVYIANNKSTRNDAIYYDQILGTGAQEPYNEIEKAFDKYKEHSVAGSDLARQDAIDLSELLSTDNVEEKFSEFGDNVVDYINNMYTDIVKKGNKFKLEDLIDSDTSDLSKLISYQSEIFDSAEEIYSSDKFDNVLKQAAHDWFQSMADEAGLSLKEYVLTANQKDILNTGAQREISDQFSNRLNELGDISKYIDISDWGANQKKAFLDAAEGANTAEQAAKQYFASINRGKASSGRMVDSLTGLNKGFDVLSNIYKDIQDGGDFDYSKLSAKSFTDNFPNLGKEYEEFIEKIASGSKDVITDETQDAFNTLVDKFVKTSEFTKLLEDNNLDLAASYLEMLGVTNAAEVVQSLYAQEMERVGDQTEALALQEQFATQGKGNLLQASNDAVVGFLDEANATNYARLCLFQLAAQEQVSGNTSLDTSGKIEAINDLAQTYLDAGSAALFAAKCEVLAQYAESGSPMPDDVADEMDDVLNGNFKLPNVEVDWKSTKTPSGGSGGGGSDQTGTKAEYEWIQRAIEASQRRADLQREIMQDETRNYEDRLAAYNELLDADKIHLENLTEEEKLNNKAISDAEEEVRRLFDAETAEDLIKKAEIGSIDPNTYRDTFGKKEITNEQKEAIDELIEKRKEQWSVEDSIRQFEKQQHEDRMLQYEVQNQKYDDEIERLQNIMDLRQSIIDMKGTTGQLITQGDYEDLIDSSEATVEWYYKKMENLRAEMSEVGNKNSHEYFELEGQLNDCESALRDCEAQQAEWNEQIKRIPIDLIDKYISQLDLIKADIQNFMDIEAADGLINTAEEYGKLVSIAANEMEHYVKQQKLLNNLLGDYEWGSEKYQETYEQIKDIDNSIASIVKEMKEWNQQILNIPLDKLNKVTEALQTAKNAMDDLQGEYDTTLSAVNDLINHQTKEIEKESKATQKAYDEKIKAIQDVLDALEKENEAREKTLAVEQAEYNLAKAENQKTVAIIKDGMLTYVADQEAIRDAQNELDEAQYNYNVYTLQKQINDLTEERDKLLQEYDDRVEALNEIADKWAEIAENIKLANEALVAIEYLGDGWQEKVLAGTDAEIYENFKGMYERLNGSEQAYEKQITINTRIATLMEEYIKAYTDGTITYEQALDGVSSIVAQMNDGVMTATESLTSIENLLGGDFAIVLTDLQSVIGAEVNSISSYYDIAEKNNDIIQKYTQTWEDLVKSVDNQIASLESAYRRAEEDAKDVGEGSSHTGSRVIGRGYGTFHDGVASGYVGGSKFDKLQTFKDLALKPLKPEEVPAILKKGELVFNKDQQNTLLGNISRLTNRPYPIVSNNGVSVTMTMGNLTFHEINNGQDFANYITRNLSSAIAQNLNR